MEILGQNSMIAEIKVPLFSSRFEMSEAKICKLGDEAIEMFKSEQ